MHGAPELAGTPMFLVFVGAVTTLFGAIIGSYLNVVIHRLPRGLSTVLPRSRCPGCGAAIQPRDNLPILSYLLLRGRCRQCGATISWRYPAVEGVTALLFLGCLLRFGLSPAALAGALFCCLMLALGAIDLEHMILPDRLTLPGIVAGLVAQHWLPWSGIWSAVAGVLLGGGILLALWLGWYLLRHEEGMGLGDVKMLALIGAFLGWSGMLVALFFAALTGAATGLVLMRASGLGLKAKLPFGTFLALGGLIGLFAGHEIVAWYSRFL